MSNKLTVFIFILFFVFPGVAFGEETAGIEVNVNSSDVEGKFEFRLPRYETNIIGGAGILYSDDNFLISNLNISLKDQVVVRPLSIGIGFKGGFGTAEKYNIDYDMATIGFLFTGGISSLVSRILTPSVILSRPRESSFMFSIITSSATCPLFQVIYDFFI